ncbi:MAG: hypothetical protein AAF492_26535 [Verrucomicrobiota bacterium]
MKWLPPNAAIELNDFRFLAENSERRTARRYDLAHFTMIVILSALFLESLLLIRRWHLPVEGVA